MLAILMVHFGSAGVTAQALAAVLPELPTGGQILLLDNGSGTLKEADLPVDARITLITSARNLGFAGGMNLLVRQALADPDVEAVLLLNNDVRAGAGLQQVMCSRQTGDGGADMVGARLMREDSPDRVDSLGITLYRSGLASNRKHLQERLLGPSGGCMLLSRRLLQDLATRFGYWFDERFFCYAEDTDLVMRARWLGYECAFADDAVALHHGSLSSGGPDNEFVLYHGIRNSIWALAKNAPALWLLVHLPWLIAAHGGIWLRNLRKGRARTLWRLYRDAARGLPAMWRERRIIRRHRQVPARAWWRWVEPRLYERDFLRGAWRELWRCGDRARG